MKKRQKDKNQKERKLIWKREKENGYKKAEKTKRKKGNKINPVFEVSDTSPNRKGATWAGPKCVCSRSEGGWYALGR